MKYSISKISIKKPCSQNWDEMADLDAGKYCLNCKSNVVDFTVLTEKQIMNYLLQSSSTCGRIESKQLTSINQQLLSNQDNKFSFKKFGVAAAIISGIHVLELNAKMVVPTEQTPHPSGIKLTIDSALKRVSGRITALEDGLPLPGADIQVKGTNIRSTSDINGLYTIDFPDNADTLSFSYIGFEKQEIKIDHFRSTFINVIFKEDSLLNSNKQNVFVGGIVVRRPFIHRVWFKIKRLFENKS